MSQIDDDDRRCRTQKDDKITVVVTKGCGVRDNTLLEKRRTAFEIATTVVKSELDRYKDRN